ncbi:MAG: hypothetical protein LBL90_10990, partial [Prevotellaceae bacterium]|nr:hypothetical protein [Prevotellaceae bacterium]
CDDPPPSGGGPGPDPEPEPKKPEKRTDCNGNAIANANNANSVLNSNSNVISEIDTLKSSARTNINERSLTIDRNSNDSYEINGKKEGLPGSVLTTASRNTIYGCHTHPNDNLGGILTGPSVDDICNVLKVVNYYVTNIGTTNFKGEIIFSYDGSEYLIAVDNISKITSTNFVLYNFMDRVACYEGKTVADVVNDLKIPVTNFAYNYGRGGNFYGIDLSIHSYPNFDNSLNNKNNYNSIVIIWDKYKDKKEEYDLMQAQDGWNEQLYNFYKNDVIKYIYVDIPMGSNYYAKYKSFLDLKREKNMMKAFFEKGVLSTLQSRFR